MRFWLVVLVTALIGFAVGVGHALTTTRDPGAELSAFLENPLPVENEINVEDAPRLVVINGEDHDFGVMDRGDTREHRFVFRNDGTKPLILGKPRTTCMCMLPDVGKGGIPPGETREVILRWTAKKHEMEFRQTATMSTSDPLRSVVTLNVYGRVVPRSRSIPATVDVGRITTASAIEKQTIIYGYQSEELTVAHTRWLKPELADAFDVEFRDATIDELEREPDAKAALVCQLKIQPGLPLGALHQRLIVDLKADRKTSLEIPIIGKVVGDVTIVGRDYRADDRTLSIGHVSQAEGEKATLFLTAKGPHREEVKPTVKLVEPAESLSVTFDPPRSNRNGASYMHTFRIEVPAGSPFVNRLGNTPDNPAGRIVIETNHPEIPEIELKVRFAVAN